MIKLATLFVRDFENPTPGMDFALTKEFAPGYEWVKNGEGKATRKWDGKGVMLKDGKWYVRYDAKSFTVDKKTGTKLAYDRKPPEGFIPAQDFGDPVTGHWPGWVPADPVKDKLLFDTVNGDTETFPDGTYELVGPKIGTRGGANPENLSVHDLKYHGADLIDVEPTFDAIFEYLSTHDVEGIVWHHPDGRMAKIKGTDFGIKRKEHFAK